LAWTASAFAALSAGGAVAQSPQDLASVPPPAVDPAASLPADWSQGPFLQIFVRGWKDGDGDGVGDLKGLTQTLDHLAAMGVTGLWLMPIQANSDGDHGYATTDFLALDPAYGTVEDLDRLIREASARGIGIIIDYVLNHASAEHAWFKDARVDPQSPWRRHFIWTPGPRPKKWYIWDKHPWYHTASQPWTHKGPARTLPDPPAGARGFYFGTFGAHMPDFNMRNPAVVAYHEDAMRQWLARGLAGFRLDATPHLIENDAENWNDQPESRALTKRFADMILSHPNRHVVCEATSKPEEWADPSVCNGAFAFGLQYEMVKAARGDLEALGKVGERLPTLDRGMATFLANHDGFAGQRLGTQFKGEPAAHRMAAAMLLLSPGIPFLYHGEDVGLENGPCPADAPLGEDGKPACGDPPLRGPMAWTPDGASHGFSTATPFRPVAPNATIANVESQVADPASLHHWYRALIAIRRAHPSLLSGRLQAHRVEGGVLQMVRDTAGERALIVLNVGATRGDVASLTPIGNGARIVFDRLATPGTATAGGLDASGGRLRIAPGGVGVVVLEK
jgi:glycosidase